MFYGPESFHEDGVNNSRRAMARINARKQAQAEAKAAQPKPEKRNPPHALSILTLLPHSTTMAAIMDAVSAETGIPVNCIVSKYRLRKFIPARHLFFWFAKYCAGKSYPQAGWFCGNRDHTTALYGARMVEKNIDHYRPAIERIKKRLNLT